MMHFDIRTSDGLTFVVCLELEKLGFRNAFSTRVDSHLSRDFVLGHADPEMAETVLQNRERFLAAIGGQQVITARQIHSAEIVTVNGGESGRVCDGMTTRQSGLMLGIQTADCLPILIADQVTGAFTAVHAGWRGSLAGIAAQAIRKMVEDWGSRPEDLVAGFGPAITASNFQLGSEVIAQFVDLHEWSRALVSRIDDDGRGYFDLSQFNRLLMIEAGMRNERIFDSGMCTIERNDLFFSYRHEGGKEKHIGRLLSVIGRY